MSDYQVLEIGDPNDWRRFYGGFRPESSRDGRRVVDHELKNQFIGLTVNALEPGEEAGYWHTHSEIEELYVFIAGEGQMGLDDDLVVFALGTIVLQVVEPLVLPLRILGSIVLLVVAAQLFRRAKISKLEARDVSESSTKNSVATFATFFGLTVINPATAFYFLAITPSVSHLNVGAGLTVNVLYFGLGVFTGSVIWQFILVSSAHFISKRMTPSLQRGLQYGGASLIAILAVWLIFK